MSEHLTAMGVEHVVLERHRIAERWRSQRWDSLVANGPAWHDRFPKLRFEDVSPGTFPTKERMARYLEDYATLVKAPIRTQYETQGHPYYASARLWDDGILDPRHTRATLALALSATYNAPIPTPRFGVFRM